MKNKILLCFFVGLLCLIPVFSTYIHTRNVWSGIVPSFVDDDLYYYARMNSVVNGYPFIGNPYFFEHRNDVSPSFFVSDWIAVIPLKLGLPFIFSLILNFIIWSIVFSLLLYKFFEDNKISKWSAFVGSLLTYLVSYSLILRPVSMQIVAPFLLFLFITFYRWFNEEKSSFKQGLFFSFVLASTFYIYTYLWVLAVFVLLITGIFYLYKRDFKKIINLTSVVSGCLVMILPMLYYSIKQITTPSYLETASRIGLVKTHLPTVLSFVDAGWVFALMSLWVISYFSVTELKRNNDYFNSLKFILVTGFALVLSLFSNVFSGQELEISNHVERFVIIWMSISLVLFLWLVFKNQSSFYKISRYKIVVIFFLVIMSTFSVFSFLIHGFNLKSIFRSDTTSVQQYAEPLIWLRDNTPKESVVWSNGEIGYYIPIVTTDYNLFNRLGALHVLSSEEVVERYLTSNYFNDLKLEDIEGDYRQYAGVGNAVHQYKTHNRKVKICNIFRMDNFGFDCGQIMDSVSYKGQNYFEDLLSEYKNNIRPNIKAELKKFKVSYIIKDKSKSGSFDPVKISGSKLIWQNSRFQIYSVEYK